MGECCSETTAHNCFGEYTPDVYDLDFCLISCCAGCHFTQAHGIDTGNNYLHDNNGKLYKDWKKADGKVLYTGLNDVRSRTFVAEDAKKFVRGQNTPSRNFLLFAILIFSLNVFQLRFANGNKNRQGASKIHTHTIGMVYYNSYDGHNFASHYDDSKGDGCCYAFR